MPHIFSCNLFADLALSTKASKILSGLIIYEKQSQTPLKTSLVATASLDVFLAQRGLYFGVIVYQSTYNSSQRQINTSIKMSASGFVNTAYEQTFVRIRPQSNSKRLSLGNRLESEELLITQLTDSDLETALENWTIWTNNRAYLYFQPTPKALSTWLKMLFDRSGGADQDSGFSLPPDSDSLLHYIKLRCDQMLKLAKSPINPWSQGELSCIQTAELELIYGVIQTYDSLYMGANYKILAAKKSLEEKFLEFDRTCRLLDLDPNAPAFHERAGLIAVVRSAVKDLSAPQF